MILNILSNLIPHKLIVYDNKSFPRFNTKIKPLIQEKMQKRCKVLRENIGNNQLSEKIKFPQNHLKYLIDI